MAHREIREPERHEREPQPSRRSDHRPPNHGVPSVLALQRSAGNHAVARVLQRVDMEAETVTSTPESRAETAQRRAVAHAAVVGEIDRAVGAVQQGHRQGLAAFAAWYGGYSSAQENATTEGAAKVF